MMAPSGLLMLFKMRLKWHPLQETFAGIGIAAGVALAFAVMVANGSVSESTAQVVDSLAGRATLQVVARDSRGFDAKLVERIRRVDGVTTAAPILEQRAVVHGPSGSSALTIASVDPALAEISEGLPAWAGGGGLLLIRGLLLPQPLATKLGAEKPGQRLALDLRGRRHLVTLSAALSRDTLGPLADAPLGVMPNAQLAALAGLPDRVTRVLVATEPGGSATVARRLRGLVGPGLRVQAAREELRLLDRALKPSNQVTAFFAGISVLLGFLLSFNAMLLTMPERRRMVALLRVIASCPRREVNQLILLEAAILGCVASLVGLAVGVLLATTVLHASTGYLSQAFTLGSGTIITHGPAVWAFIGGLAACVVASAPPIFDVFGGRAAYELLRAQDAPGHSLKRPVANAMLALALPMLGVAIMLLSRAPGWALVAAALLAVSTVLVVPTLFRAVVAASRTLSGRSAHTNMLGLALASLRATTLRSLALAATGAIALYGCIAIGGARSDLIDGIRAYAHDYVSTADLWIVNRDDNQATNDLRAPPALNDVPGVAAVRQYRGGFHDLAGQRVWIIGRPRNDRMMLPASQVLDRLPEADALVKSGRWIATSDSIARAQDAQLGDRIVLSTPTGPKRFRLAATMTNLGWAPGAIVMSANDYRRDWGATSPTAIEIDLAANADARRVAAALQREVGAGVVVQSAAQREAGILVSARQGLARLQQIEIMLLGAAVIALSAAITAAIWQRRRWLAQLRLQGCHIRQVWAVLLWESAIVLGTGCLAGAVVGSYGQAGADRYLKLVAGFPVSESLAGKQAITVFAIVVGAALFVIAIPGWLAARVPLTLDLRHE